jgi:cellulose synthase/poly-beta-1,6-N-acetylglucosamine synthase-like glycosyltransferase
MRLSVLITAYQEPTTIKRALKHLIPQVNLLSDEIIVICPDDETAAAAQKTAQIRVIKDPGTGKPAALNLGLSVAKGDIIVMTDGDVYITYNAIAALIAPFAEEIVGAVSGHPKSLSPRDTMLGYWSHLLTEAGAHTERLERDRAGKFFVCSGYLYAIRGGIIDAIPEDSLAEDAVVSHLVAEQGFRVRYAPDADVFVLYPSTYADWLKQKVRSAGGYTQSVIAHSNLRMRSFLHEAWNGWWRAIRYARTFREFRWTLALFAARLHLWLLIFWRVRIRHESLIQLWKRVETTKGV